MTTTLEINQEIYQALQDSFGLETLKERINEILLTAIESRLERYNQQILHFEEKYGMSFKEFDVMWDNDQFENRHSYEIESDYMDWEMLEAEKKDLINALRRMRKVLTR